MNGSFSLVSLYFPQREIAIPYPRKKPLLSRMGKKRLFAYASLFEGGGTALCAVTEGVDSLSQPPAASSLKEGALYQNLTRSAM